MKKLFIMLLAGFSLGITEVKAAVQLKLSLTDGTAKTFLLSEKPVITLPDDQMTVTTPEATFSCLRSEVATMEFDELASVSEIPAMTGRFSFLNGIIECDGSPIEVYDLGGVLRASGHDALSTESLNNGIYIVKTNQHVVKISKNPFSC